MCRIWVIHIISVGDAHGLALTMYLGISSVIIGRLGSSGLLLLIVFAAAVVIFIAAGIRGPGWSRRQLWWAVHSSLSF